MPIIRYPLVVNIRDKPFETVNRKRGDRLCHEETGPALWVKVRLAAVTPEEEVEEAEWAALPPVPAALACAPNAETKYRIRPGLPVRLFLVPNAGP